jgi:hypothetical protein
MTTIFERTETALNTLTTITNAMDRLLTASGDLPDIYLVYSLVSSAPVMHHNNIESGRNYVVQVSIFSRAGLVTLPNVDAAMLAAGFRRGDERALPRDEQSGHYHLAKDFNYFEETTP